MPTETQINRHGRVHGEFSSADAQTGSAATMYELGTKDTRALAATEKLAILSVIITCAATARVVLFADDDDDNVVDGGEILAVANCVAGSAVHLTFDEKAMPEGTLGGVPHVIASAAGQVDVVFEGIIRRPNS